MKSLRLVSVPAALAILLALGACATMPNGPSVMVLPGDGKSFDQFRFDDSECRQFASAQVSGSVNAANDSAAKGAVIGTLLGAAAGAAIGGDHRGAGVGAGAGLLMGSAAGSGNGASSGGLQRRYDNGYVQCMYSKGHKVPQVSSTSRRTANYVATAPQPVQQQPAPAVIPPPPAGMPPPPPPGVSSPR